MAADQRTMFEIYRESGYNRTFRSIFYTELEEHGRDAEIARAASGDTLFSGFLDDATKDEARTIVQRIVDDLNAMDEDRAELDPDEIAARLRGFLVDSPIG